MKSDWKARNKERVKASWKAYYAANVERLRAKARIVKRPYVRIAEKALGRPLHRACRNASLRPA